MAELLIAIVVMLLVVGSLAGWMVRKDQREWQIEDPQREEGGGASGGTAVL